MDSLSSTIDLLVNRLELTCCEHCGCEIDVSDLTLFDQIICPECNLQGTVPCRLGPYLMEDRIGSGAMGTVYKAVDEFLDRPVAIKVLKKKLGENKETIEKFKQEAMAIAQLNHPNIAQIYAFGEQDEQPYIVMEYLPGDDMKDMMEKQKQLPQSLVLKAGVDIARALEAASEVRIIHGDVKPENITFDEKKNAKLVDFGIATFEYGGAAKGIFGTPYYIAPERVEGANLDTRADMYSLGATMFHALTGRPPFVSPSNSPVECARMRLQNDPPPLFRLRRAIHPDVNKLVLRMMEREPGLRHPNYTSLIRDMQRCYKEVIKTEKSPQSAAKVATTQRTAPRTKPASPKTIRTRPAGTRPQARSSASSATQHPSRSTARPQPRASTRQVAQKKSKAPVAISVVIGVVLAVVAVGVIMESQNKKQQQAATADMQATLNANLTAADKKVAEIEKIKERISEELQRLNELKPEALAELDPSFSRDIAAQKKIYDAVMHKAQSAARDVKRLVERSAKLRESIARPRSVQGSAADLREIEGLSPTMKAYLETSTKLVAKAKEANIATAKVIERFKASALAREEAEKERLRKEQVKKDQEKRIADIKQQAQKDKERKAKAVIEEEKKELAELSTRIETLIKINDFDQAFKELTKLYFKTEAIRANHDKLKEKITRLTQWKHWIVTQLAAAPIKEGWTENGKRHNITEAYETGFRIPGGFVPWKNVPPRKLLAFFNYFVAKAQLDNLQRSKLFYAAMTYCHETGVCQGVELYLDKAAEYDPTIKSNKEAIAMLEHARESMKDMPKKPAPAKPATVAKITPPKPVGPKENTILNVDFTRMHPPKSLKVENKAQMKNGVRTKKGKPLSLSTTVSNGFYELYFTVDPSENNIAIELEETHAASGITRISPARKATIGPFITEVKDEELNIALLNSSSDSCIKNLKINQLPEHWRLMNVENVKEMLAGKKTVNGLRYKYYETEKIEWMPDFSELQPQEEGRSENVVGKIPGKRKEFYAIAQTGYLDVPVGGNYLFRLASDDGSRLYLNNKLVVDNDGSHGPEQVTGSIPLSKGKNLIKTTYFQGEGEKSIKLEWKLPGAHNFSSIDKSLFSCIDQ